MTPNTLREKIREIVTNCVITGYTNANELIDKSTTAILEAVRSEMPEEIDSREWLWVTSTMTEAEVEKWNAYRQEVLRILE